MGPNLTEKAIEQAAGSVTALCHIRDQFDKESNVPWPVATTAHATIIDEDDVAN